MSEHDNKLRSWKAELEGRDAIESIVWASKKFGDKLKFASSLGLEDQAITHIIATHCPAVAIFTLDTGRLFPETYKLIERTENQYQIRIRIYFPDHAEVEDMVAKHGVNLFYEKVEFRKMCCGVRKIHPLRRALEGTAAWICGLRQDQGVSRTAISKIEWDEGNGLFKMNPLFDWSQDQLWDYIREHNIPYNELHDQGFPSIGCSCCTRAIKTGDDIRSGRWWWEQPEQKECGLHVVDGKLVRIEKGD